MVNLFFVVAFPTKMKNTKRLTFFCEETSGTGGFQTKRFCQGAKSHSDEALLAAALLKRMADVLFTVRKDVTLNGLFFFIFFSFQVFYYYDFVRGFFV